MHEEAVLRDLVRKLEEVARTNGVPRVRGFTVWIGGMAHLTEDQLRGRFPMASRGTAAEGARIQVERSTDLTDPRAQGVVLVNVDLDDADAVGGPAGDGSPSRGTRP